MEFFHLIRATQKSGQPDAVVWLSAKTESRANLQLDVILEDAGIETGRGKDYMKPVRTDFPVYDDLPEESEIDLTWCEKYQLADDQRTWEMKLKSDAESGNQSSGQVATGTVDDNNARHPVNLSFEKRVIGTWLFGHFDELTDDQMSSVSATEMDMDATYVQNVLLASRSVTQLRHVFHKVLVDLYSSAKTVWPENGKAPTLSDLVSFFNEWIDNRGDEKPTRQDVTDKWQKKYGRTQHRTDTGTAAGGGIKTDRNPDYVHTLDTLDLEIALATLPMDFDIYNFPASILRRAKEIVSTKEKPFILWSNVLRKTPGILDFSRAAIFAVIRTAPENVYVVPGNLQAYINANLTEYKHDNPSAETLVAATTIFQSDEPTREDIDKFLSAERGEYVEGISDPANPKWVHEERVKQPEVTNLGGGKFAIDALIAPQDTTTKSEGTGENVQMEETQQFENKTDIEVPASQSPDATHPETDTVISEAEPVWPEYFEPGRYEGLPNEVYHAANGNSSTMIKDARVSLMYFEARHVSKTIQKERTAVLDMGNLVHALALQPETLETEFSLEPVIPEGAFTTTATIRTFIDEYNASLPALLSADDIKALLEEYNATLPAQFSLGGDKDAIGVAYLELPDEFKRIVGDDKNFTAAAMKACIKEYNATLPAQVKTSGSRDTLLEQLALINPDLVAQEAQKVQPLKVSGTKADLIQAVKSVNPEAVFADELLDAWRENPESKVLVTLQQMDSALAIQKSLLSHPTAGKLLTHPSRSVEVSYFGIDDETGLEVRVRPDLEIDMDGLRIGGDLKTISMWNVKQDFLRARLHREIIDRDYHLSAAMYCDVAGLDQFYWIFVNKDENYHWIAIVEATEELLELGRLEYRKVMRGIANGFDTGVWPAPITTDYADELNDFDLSRLETLRTQA